MAKQARTVLSLTFGLADRYDAIPKNPVRDATRLNKPPSDDGPNVGPDANPNEPGHQDADESGDTTGKQLP